ncbi:MAG: DUF1254 domain-containing protein [Candidatus Babeliaceae bacterium]
MNSMQKIITACSVWCIMVTIIFGKIPPISEKEAFEIGVKAYIYAYPLVIMTVTQQAMTYRGISNKFVNIPTFPTYTFKNIVRPNVDTLYSFAWLDLSQEPLILSVPDTQGRYYLMELMDAWTNVFASLGKRTTGTKAQHFALVGPFWEGTLPQDIKKIKAPTSMVLILGRTQTNGKDDYTFVHQIQIHYTLTSLPEWDRSLITTSSCTFWGSALSQQVAPVDKVAQMDVQTFYTVFTQALKNNPPQKQDCQILTELKKIGIEPGKDFEHTTLSSNIMSSLNKAMKEAQKTIAQKKDTIKTTNGWAMIFDIGTYGTDYLMRALIAQMGIGANLPQDALYPTAFIDSKGRPLNGAYNYVIHFDKDKLPPVNAFWSITLYNSKNFLVKNSIERYAIGDRDNFQLNQDGSLDIYIQHKTPGKDKELNWLPAPAADFNLTMRLYWPKKSVLNKKWDPPAITRI